MSTFKPGDRVYVDDHGLAELRRIMREATGVEPEPNHHGTVHRVYDDAVEIEFDDYVVAIYDEDEVHLLEETR